MYKEDGHTEYQLVNSQYSKKLYAIIPDSGP
jgi:hypothetical protein